MKKLIITLFAFLLLAGTAFADDWYSANQATVRWNAVTTLINGNLVPEGDLVTYVLYLKSVQTGSEIEVDTVVVTEYLFTFTNEGDYHVGIKAVRTVPAMGELPERTFESAIGWSSDPLIAKDGNTFGVSYYLQPSGVSGLEL
ncbi:MAG: hypothetical protein KAJ93_08760 [Methanosarcinales archaeon]|nr:hypothetical protein [Methanosarcinales archaeon]